MSPQQCRSPRRSERRRHSKSLRPAVSSATPRLPEYGAGSSRTHQMFTSRCQEGRPDLTPGCQSPRCGRGTAVTSFRNLSITTPEQTFSDLATSLDLVALVVLGESLVKSGRTSVAALRGLCCTTTPSKQLRAALINARAAKRPRSGNRPRSGTIPAIDYGCGQSRSSGN